MSHSCASLSSPTGKPHLSPTHVPLLPACSRVGAYRLLGDDLTERDATLCFVWSRMKFIDVQLPATRIKWTHLSFEDWLEALCRIAKLKAWPTDDEVRQAGFPNAGSYVLEMRDRTPESWPQWVVGRATPWGGTPRLPIAYCVSCLCELLVASGDVNGDDAVSKGEADSYIDMHGARGALQ